MVNYKKYGKKVVKRSGKALKSRYVKGGKANPNQMWKDIMLLKSIVNAEKKQITISPITTLIGQVNGNAEGAYTVDITPAPHQGNQDSQRSGDSIKISTAVFDFQVKNMSAATHPMMISIEIYSVLGTPQATSTFLNQLYVPTSFLTGTSIRDFHAKYDQDYRQQYKLIAKRIVRLKGDNFSGQTQIKNIKVPLKFGTYGHHVKYVENSNIIASGQLMMIVRCDSGNLSASTTSTINNVAITEIGTGAIFNQAMQYYYYDN